MKFKLFGLVFSVTTQKTVKVPDFMQEAKEASFKFVPKDSDKIFYMLARFAHATGAMREHLRYNPKAVHDPKFVTQILAASNLWHQFDSSPLFEATNDLDRIAEQVFRPEVLKRCREMLKDKLNEQG